MTNYFPTKVAKGAAFCNRTEEIERLKNKISYDANNFEDLIEKEKEKINSNFQSDMYELKKKHNGEIKRISINITII